MTVGGNLTLTSGDLELGDYDLTLSGSTSHGSSSSYIKLNGTGKVKATVGSDPVILPVGRNPYLPVIIDDGGDAEYTVGVSDNVYDNPQTQTGAKSSNVVSETWTVQASTSVNNVSIQVGWDAAEEESGFARSLCMLGYWEDGVSTKWNADDVNGAASGSDPYSVQETLNLTTNTFYLGVGSQGSALPVELTYFKAEWGTSTSPSNPGFKRTLSGVEVSYSPGKPPWK